MDFYSSTCTIPRDDSMSSSLPDNENRTIPDNTRLQLDFFNQSLNENPVDFKLLYQYNGERQIEQLKYYPQNQMIMINEDQIACDDQPTPVNKHHQQVVFYDSQDQQPESSFSYKYHTSQNSSPTQHNNHYNQKKQNTPLYDNMRNRQQQASQNSGFVKQIIQGQFNNNNLKEETNFKSAEQQQRNNFAYLNQQINQSLSFQQNSTTRQTIYLTNGTNASNNCINQLRPNLSQVEETSSPSSHPNQQLRNEEMEGYKEANQIAQLKSEEINDSLDNISCKNNGSNLELDSNINNKRQQDQIIAESQDNNNKYRVTELNNLDVNNIIEANKDHTHDSAQHSQQIAHQYEHLIPREFSFISILPATDGSEQLSALQNKFLIEGGVLIDLNEFTNPETKDTRMTTISQFYSFTQLQKFKKYIVANLELKSLPERNFSEIISRLQQFNETNEKAARLTASLQDYQQFIQERKLTQEEQSLTARLISENNIHSSQLNLESKNHNNHQVSSVTNIPSHIHSTTQFLQNPSQLIIEGDNQQIHNLSMVDPYSSSHRTNTNLRQADKILKQFEKYCYTFHILRKSPVQIESIQMGVSTSLIELLGMNPNDSISASLRSISSGMLPFDYAGCDPSEQSIDEIYQIVTSLKEKQKYYNRKQSLQYGELKHSCGKNVKVKIQSKVFLLNSYSPLTQNQTGNQNNNFNEDQIGDYLEIKLYTPETLEVQKVSKKRTSSSRKGAVSEEDCLEMDKNERKIAYMNHVQNLLNKFYSDDSLLSPELIFRKKWAVKSNKQNE